MPKQEADSPSPQLKLSKVKPLTLGVSQPDSSSDENSDDNDNEVNFPESVVELEDKKNRRRQQLLEDMQGFYNEGSSEDSDENSFFTEQSRGTIDVKAKARISLEKDAEETKKEISSEEDGETSFDPNQKKQGSKTISYNKQMTAMEKSDSYNSKLNRGETKHLTLAPGTRAPGRSVTGIISDPADLRRSCDQFQNSRRSAMRASSPSGKSPRKHEAASIQMSKLADGEAEDFFAENLARISELADS